MEAAVLIMVIAILLIYFVLFSLLAVSYIISALAMQKIGNKVGISNSWLAWIPYANSWLLGAIVDEYDNRNGMKRNWKKLLLILTIAGTGVIMVGYLLYIIALIIGSAVPAVLVVGVIVFYLFVIVGAFLASAKGFCDVICIYKIFEAEAPEKAIKYLLIHLLVPLGGSICLMKCGKQESVEEPEKVELPQLEESSDVTEK